MAFEGKGECLLLITDIWKKALNVMLNEEQFLKEYRLKTAKEFSEEEKDIFVNERFVCYLVIYECLAQIQKTKDSLKLDKESMQKFDKYIELLLYYFKYRQYNPQVIELVIETFKIGLVFG